MPEALRGSLLLGDASIERYRLLAVLVGGWLGARTTRPIAALVDATLRDDAIAKALLAKKNPVIERALEEAKGEGKAEGKAEGKLEGKAEGKLDGKREALLGILAARGLKVSKKAEKRLRAERDEAVLDRWLAQALTCADVEALLGK